MAAGQQTLVVSRLHSGGLQIDRGRVFADESGAFGWHRRCTARVRGGVVRNGRQDDDRQRGYVMF